MIPAISLGLKSSAAHRKLFRYSAVANSANEQRVFRNQFAIGSWQFLYFRNRKRAMWVRKLVRKPILLVFLKINKYF